MTFAAWLDVAAAARAALRRSRGLAQVLVRLKIELLFALGAAEVIRLPFVLGLSSGGSRLYVHTADRIFHNCCTRYFDFPFVREFGLDGRPNVDWPVPGTHPALNCLFVVWKSPAQCTGTEISNRGAVRLSKNDHCRPANRMYPPRMRPYGPQ